MIKYINRKKQSRRGVYCSTIEGIASNAERHLDAHSIIKPTHQWKDCSNEGHHDHSPALTVHGSNIPLLAKKEAELRENGEIVSWRDADGLPDEDVKKVQRQTLVQSIVKERRTTFVPLSCSKDYDQIKTHHNLMTSTHILINEERGKRYIMPLCRERELDELASDQAKLMATGQGKEHSDVEDLISKISGFSSAPFRRIGENVCGGITIDAIYKKLMGDPRYESDRNNMFDTRFSSFGIGVAISCKGKVYICQIYKG